MESAQQVRAGCYLRISSDPKDRRAGVDRQREDTAALCEIKGWRVAGLYIDNDKSASNGKARPEWDRLLADIAAGRIDAIAAWDQDRGWRMMDDLQRLRKTFGAADRPVLIATTGQGDIDLYSPTGILAAQIKTAVSEHEVAMMKVRMRRAARQKAEKGLPQWRNAFGYRVDGSRTPDPVTAPLVKQAYAAVIAGSSLADICRLFNDAGAFGSSGKPWSASLVSQFLRKPRNAGLRSHHGEIVGKGTWPPLVDESTWRAAQSVMDAPGRAPGRKTVRKHLLTGVLGCGKCGHYLSGAQTADRTRIAYVCKGCRGVSVRAELVEPIVTGLVAGRLAMADAVDLLRAEQDDAEAEALRIESNTLRARLDEIAAERAQGLIDGRGYRVMLDRINEQLAALERRQRDAERVRVFDGLPLGTPEVAAAVAKLSPDRLRAVIDVLVTFTVMPKGKSGNVFDPSRVRHEWKR